MGNTGPNNPNPPPSDSAPTGLGWSPPAVEDVDALIPGRYEVLELLGAGGMAAVYKARHDALNRFVAIKILPHASTGESDEFNFAERFKLEAQAMANLSHPGIVAVHDFGDTDTGLFYFVMEYIDGTDALGYLREHGGMLPEDQALTITAHVLDALSYAHEHGIIHRDIKPANVLINSEGQVKIADFGLAKHSTAPASASLTRTNMAMGTPDFVAPEALVAGTHVDQRADLYAVGVMLYQMLTGELPRGRFKLPAEKVPGLDLRIDPLVGKAMAADPQERYRSATEMRAAVDELFTQPVAKVEPGSPSAAIPIHQPPVKQNSAALIATAVIAGIPLVALIAWLVFKPTDMPEGGQRSIVAEASPATPASAKDTPATPKTEETPASERESPTPAPTDPKPATKQMEGAAPSAPNPSPTTPEKPAAPAPAVKSEIRNQKSETPSLPEFTTRHDNYQKALAAELATLTKSYTAAVARALDAAIRDGDLDSSAALRSESRRLEKSEPLPKSGPPALPGSLASLRDTYRTERVRIENSLARDLDKSLRALEVTLTRQKRIDDALAVKTWRKSLPPPAPEPAPLISAATSPPSVPVAAPSKGDVVTAMGPAKATRDKPFENSLGMRFVVVPITGGPSDGKRVLFSVWETRVSDYEAFIRKDRKGAWPEPGFKQDGDHPAVMVSWDDAMAFCEWLTEDERKKGLIGKEERYRLPTDHEWSCGVGIGVEEDAGAAPVAKSGKLGGVYPWGGKWPPPKGAGNYYGEETKRNPVDETKEPIEGYDDGYDRTAPVGSFEANAFGLYDLGGNVWEWCEDWFGPAKQDRHVLRGAAWSFREELGLRSSSRLDRTHTFRYGNFGFRCVLAAGSGS
jgi:serine/threonine protein kinase